MSVEKLERPTRLDDDRIAALRELFPAAFSEGRVNLEALRDELADHLDEVESGDEHYGLSWPGKRAAKRLAAMAPSGTLAPAPGEGVDEASTQNLIIEGENLEVLRILQKAYAGRVKLIYIDPPYNTGNDFVYKDDFKEPVEKYLEASGQADMAGLLTSNPKSSGRYHSVWLSMMYSRLVLARELLVENGLIFISIDENEVVNLRHLLNEIFGEESFIAQIIIESNKRGQTYKEVSQTHEYLLCYSASDLSKIHELEKEGEGFVLSDSIGGFEIRELRNRNPKFGRFNRPNLFFPIYVAVSQLDKDGFAPVSLVQSDVFSKEVLPLNSAGIEGCWRWGKPKVGDAAIKDTQKSNLVAKQRRDGGWNIYEKYRKTTYRVKSIWDETEVLNEQGTIDLKSIGLGGIFDFPKPVALLKKVLQMGASDGDIVLDFFAGSGTLGQASYELQREETVLQFILVQLSIETPNDSIARKAGYERISEITKQRLRLAGENLKQDKSSGDLGFRVLKLAKSNVVRWRGDKATSESLDDLIAQMQSTLVPGWKTEDVLTELMLLEGYPLDSSKTQSPDFDSNLVYSVTHPDKQTRLLVCLDDRLEEATVEQLTSLPDLERKTFDFICLDAALTDQLKARLADKVRVKTI